MTDRPLQPGLRVMLAVMLGDRAAEAPMLWETDRG